MRSQAAARRTLLAFSAAALLLVSGPVLAGPEIDRAAGLLVLGHSQLVSSSPGAGDVVAVAPTEIRLVFSEPIDPNYTSLDLLDGTGKAILVDAGAPDPADPRTLVAPIAAGTALPTDTLYTVNWRALSAADGHTTDGFLTFGVGNVAVGTGGARGVSGSGALHGGHSGGTAAAEIQGKVLAYGGSMLALGLAILAWLVLRPALGRIPRGATYGAGIALLVGAAGCVLLVVVAADSLPGGGGDRLRPVCQRVAGWPTADGEGDRRTAWRTRRPRPCSTRRRPRGRPSARRRRRRRAGRPRAHRRRWPRLGVRLAGPGDHGRRPSGRSEHLAQRPGDARRSDRLRRREPARAGRPAQGDPALLGSGPGVGHADRADRDLRRLGPDPRPARVRHAVRDQPAGEDPPVRRRPRLRRWPTISMAAGRSAGA